MFQINPLLKKIGTQEVIKPQQAQNPIKSQVQEPIKLMKLQSGGYKKNHNKTQKKSTK